MKSLFKSIDMRGKVVVVVLLVFITLFVNLGVAWAQSDISVPTGKFVGEYYNDVALTEYVYTEETESIDFDWGEGSPSPSIDKDSFSARWRGNFFFEEGRYNFVTQSDDGVRIFIDNELRVNRWRNQLAVPTRNLINVTGGAHQVRVEYFESGGGASVKVEWERVGEIVTNGDSGNSDVSNGTDDAVSGVSCIRLDTSLREGAVPLRVDFVGLFDDPKNQITEYVFDFGEEADGVSRTVTLPTRYASYTYENSGSFTASVQANDVTGGTSGGRGGDCEVTINVSDQVVDNEEEEEEEPDVLVANNSNELPDTGIFDYTLLGLTVVYGVVGAYLLKKSRVICQY
jgi:hypothetical protein